MPPVSTMVKAIPRQSESPKSRSRVVPGISDVTDLRSPISRLKSVDLPTFGRPTSATIGFRIARSYYPTDREGPAIVPFYMRHCDDRFTSPLALSLTIAEGVGGEVNMY